MKKNLDIENNARATTVQKDQSWCNLVPGDLILNGGLEGKKSSLRNIPGPRSKALWLLSLSLPWTQIDKPSFNLNLVAVVAIGCNQRSYQAQKSIVRTE